MTAYTKHPNLRIPRNCALFRVTEISAQFRSLDPRLSSFPRTPILARDYNWSPLPDIQEKKFEMPEAITAGLGL